jgi:hypothetical protein
MFSRYLPVAHVVICLSFLLVPRPNAVAQDYDREAYAREYVQFVVTEIDQWSKDFPHQFYLALMKPPVDATKLTEEVKASAGEFGDSVKKLLALSGSKDVTTSAQFKDQLDKTLAAAKLLKTAMGSQRFPDAMQSDWSQMRFNLNSLARIYKGETLAYLDPPGGGGGRGGRRGGAAAAAAGAPGRGGAPAAAAPPGAVVGYIVDQRCAIRGKGMWTNVQCIERCVRDGDKVVLVTEEGKVYQIANQDKINADTYGQVVTVTGKTEGDTITVENLTM